VEGLRQFCRIETIVEDRFLARALSGLIARQLQFPYSRKVLRLVDWLLPQVYR
jgi:hypothetical protein